MTTIEIEPLATDRILCVKVGKVIRENLYEMTRKYVDKGQVPVIKQRAFR